MEKFGGVPAAVVHPGVGPGPVADTAATAAPIVHLHGGGYRLGAAAGWVGFAHRLATATGRRVVVPEYRLAPEHPFPAALRDAAAVWRAVTAGAGAGAAPVLTGDSAGGGLAVALALALRDGTVAAPLPDRLALFSPLLGLRADADSYRTNAERDQLWSRTSALEAADAYLQGLPADSTPLASPLLADPAGLPPVLLFAGTGETLLDDATAFAARAARAQVRVEAHYVPDVPHVWPVLLDGDPRSAAALSRVAAFVGRRA